MRQAEGANLIAVGRKDQRGVPMRSAGASFMIGRWMAVLTRGRGRGTEHPSGGIRRRRRARGALGAAAAGSGPA